jgi:hypothetical protein
MAGIGAIAAKSIASTVATQGVKAVGNYLWEGYKKRKYEDGLRKQMRGYVNRARTFDYAKSAAERRRHYVNL